MRRLGLFAALGVLLALLAPARADAVDVSIAAQVLAGSRTITTATLTPLADVLRTVSVSGTLAVTVTEAAVAGVDPWSVTARLCGPNAGGTAADCAADPDRLVLTGATSTKITGANLSVASRAVVQTLGGGTATAVSGTEALSTTRTLFSTTGQSAASIYTGTYASTATVSLTPPSDATPGAYTGYLVVTLVS